MDPLVERARQGDRAAIEALLAHVAPAVHRFSMRMCKNVHDAEDVLQDTLLNVANHLGDFEGRSSLSSWVFAITRSACSRRRRGLKNQPSVSVSDVDVPEPADGSPSPEALVADQELADALSRSLDSLSEEHREVILLRDVEGLSAPEAAEAIGISVDALKSRLHRAREALRVALRPLTEPAVSGAPSTPGAPNPTCPDVALLWSKKLEGELNQLDCASMEQHIQTCPRCASACDSLKRALLACKRVSEGDVPPAVQARVRAAVKAWAANATTT